MAASIIFKFEAIGTKWSIELFGTDSSDNTAAESSRDKAIEQKIRTRIEAFDRAYSRFRDDSLVTEMSRKAGKYRMPDDFGPMYDLYRKLYEATGGAVTPLIGQTLSDAGYDARYTFAPKSVAAPPEWDDVLEYDAPFLTLKRPALLDFGAAGKGYLADLVAETIREAGATDFYIDGGGDIVHRSSARQKVDIALEHPTDAETAIGIARLGSGSLCGSGISRRAWQNFHHIIDPHSLRSPQEILALWVAAKTGLLADGLATGLFFTSPDKLKEHFNFEYAIVRADLSLEHSKNFPAEFFTKN